MSGCVQVNACMRVYVEGADERMTNGEEKRDKVKKK